MQARTEVPHLSKQLVWGGRSSEGDDPNSVESVPIRSLTVGDGPRFTGEDVAHIRRLMDVVDKLPPIIVQRSTMRVLDGVHRLRAVHLVGGETIRVVFFDGGEESAFVKSVEANVTHGLPLSTAERRAAAERIMASHPDWSDRRIAAVAGLSARTVADIRTASDGAPASGGTRLGRDGRVRPVDADRGRRCAGRLLTERPNASLREIARLAGISPETVRDVRNRLARGEDPTTRSRRGKPDRPEPDGGDARAEPGGGVGGLASAVPGSLSPDRQGALAQALRRDPSLRFSESGRLLLRWLEVSQAAVSEWDRIVRAVPSHRMQQIAELAKSSAQDWGRLADQISSRATTQPSA